MSRKRWKAYGKENTTIEWDDGGKIGNKIKLILTKNLCMGLLDLIEPYL